MLLLVAAAAAAGVIFGLARHGDRVEYSEPEFLPKGQDLGLSEVRQTAMKAGRLQWELFAGTAGFVQKENQATLESVRVDFHAEDGRIIRVRADQGVVDTRTNDVDLTGHVEAKDGSYTLKTESLRYESGRERISGNARTHLTGKGLAVAGDAFEYDLSAGRLNVLGNVEGMIGDEDPIVEP